MFKGLHHIGIAVHDIDESVRKYEQVFNGKVKLRHTAEDHCLRLVFIEVGRILFELLQPLSPGKGYIGEFLDKHGEGLHHLAFNVDDVENSLAELKEMGVKLRDEKPRFRGGRFWIAFISPDETNNVPWELLQSMPESPCSDPDDDPDIYWDAQGDKIDKI
jgi:methylmalonyl-CoA/ethylmalonyl-CoA epimerase